MGLLDISRGAEYLALGGIGLSGHTGQFFLNHTEFADELPKGFAFCGIGCCHGQSSARAADGARAQLQTPNVEDVEGDFVAFVDLAKQVLDRDFGIFKVDLAGG